MTNVAEPAAAATALVLSKDQSSVKVMDESIRPLAIRLQVCSDSLSAIGLLNKQKFEAVIADLELGEDSALVMRQLRYSPANRTAVSFVMTAASENLQSMTRPHATFVLQRPLSNDSVSGTFRAAYGLMVRERRRYFRASLKVTGCVQAHHGQDVSCQVLNISEGGMAIVVSSDPSQEFSRVRFTLPGHPGHFFAGTRVCWRGDNGRVGLEFTSLPQKADLQEWLARKLDESLPESVAQLFRRGER